MKLATTSLVLASLVAVGKAQFSGAVTTENRGSCPIPIRDGDDTNYSWDPENGDSCIALDQSVVNIESYHAALIGHAELPDAVEPSKFGACSDAKCTKCTLVDVRRRTDRPGTIESDCVEFANAPYLFVGAPLKEEL